MILCIYKPAKPFMKLRKMFGLKGMFWMRKIFTPSARSKILFVQLIEDKTDKVVWVKKYEIENGFVNGHLFFKNDLPEGSYTLPIIYN